MLATAQLRKQRYQHQLVSSINQQIANSLNSSKLHRKWVKQMCDLTESLGTGGLSSVSYAGGRAYDRRPHIYLYDNPLQSDIQLLSYYINKFKQEKAYSGDSSKGKN